MISIDSITVRKSIVPNNLLISNNANLNSFISTVQQVGLNNKHLAFYENYNNYQDKHYGYKIQSGFITIKTSLPKLLNHINNFQQLDLLEIKEALVILEKELFKNGINISVYDALISAIEFFKNIEIDEEYPLYSNLLKNIQWSSNKMTKYYDSFYLNMEDRTIKIYDKINELTKKQVLSPGLPDNCLRIETTYQNNRSVKKHLGICNVRDIFSNYDELEEEFNRFVHKKILKNLVSAIAGVSIYGNVNVNSDVLAHIMKTSSGNASSLKKLGYYYLYEKNLYDKYISTLRNNVSPPTVYTSKREYAQIKNELEMLKNNNSSNKTNIELANELIAKIQN